MRRARADLRPTPLAAKELGTSRAGGEGGHSMHQGMRILGLGLMAAIWLGVGPGARAQEVNLMQGVTPRPGDERMTAPNQFKKNGPWKIGMSHFGVNANTWTVQMAHDAEAAAKLDKRAGQFILLDANLSQAKQVADIEDLIAQKVDAIVVTPVTPTSADAGIEKAVAAG